MSHESQNSPHPPAKWQIHVSKEWDVLGPFPIHAREQYFYSPCFPLEVSPSYTHEPDRTWPSKYSSNGSVGWSKAVADANGNLAVSFPDVNWDTLRSTEGWAALQYHSVLRARLTVYPPSWNRKDHFEGSDDSYNEEIKHSGEIESENKIVPVRVLATLTHGSQFAILPTQGDNGLKPREQIIPVWHVGNIYGLNRAPPNAIELPRSPSPYHPTTYDVFVSGDYEIRLFGDPKDAGHATPTLRVSFAAELEPKESKVVRDESHDVIPDFVDGYAFGDSMGVGLRSVDGWWLVRSISLGPDFPQELKLSLKYKPKKSHIQKLGLLGTQRSVPAQTRMAPLILEQNEPCHVESITFTLHLVELGPMENFKDGDRLIDIEITLALKQLPLWNATSFEVIKASFFFCNVNPTGFLVKPPAETKETGTEAPFLALHGAGVDIFATLFWAETIPRQKHSWIILPPGRTEWGCDWHGPSASEAWATISALSNTLKKHQKFHAWRIADDAKVILIGHSNGGQGVWHLGARFPDRVLAAVPAAGYIKSQAYVPLTQSRAGNYIDPSLWAILESSLTPDDNDLFLSNLIDIPVLAIHGGADTNVPTWHSRQYVATMKGWGAKNVNLHIDVGKPHFYPDVFKGPEVIDFIQNVMNENITRDFSPSFTLTVVNPAHSGSLRGWSIDSLKVPGRVARLHIALKDETISVRTENVKRFTIGRGAFGSTSNIEIDKSFDSRCHEYEIDKGVTFFFCEIKLKWKIEGSLSRDGKSRREDYALQPKHGDLALGSIHGRVQDVLDSPGTHTIVVKDDSPSALSVAQRVAHVLNVYLKLDAAIFTSDEALALYLSHSVKLPPGNIIVLGRSAFGDEIINHHYTPFHLHRHGLKYTSHGHYKYNDPGTGFILLQPHLTNPDARAIIMSGTDWSGVERAVRLFPYRTGVPVPDFMIIGPGADGRGAAGVLGAGVFDDVWKHNAAMTWQS